MRTLRGRIGLALLTFALITLATVGGALWVVLRDLHRDAGTAALADLLVPYVTQARARLLPGLLDGERPDPGRRAGMVGRLLETRRFIQDAQEEIAAAGVTMLLARDDGAIVIISPEGDVQSGAVDPHLVVPPNRGEVTRGVIDLAGVGPSVYAATRIGGTRLEGDVAALVLARPDDAARLATEDLFRALIVAALLLLVVGIPLAAWLGRSVARPLERLASASEVVGRGQVPVPLPVDGPAEVGRASAAFNVMAGEVATGREAQRRLLADVRHDLRTPLTVISGFAEALRDGTASGPSAVRAADAIADEAARLGRMLADLDELPDLEAGVLALALEPLDARDLVEQAVGRFRPQADARAQTIRSRATGGVSLLADRTAAERILANLVGNAMAHAPSPGGTIEIEVRAVRPTDPPVGGRGGWQGRPGVVLAVRDDGPGIPLDALPRVFDRFYRADPARSGPGSGLGLAIVAGLAHAQGGRAFAEVPPEGGARVGVVLAAALASPALPPVAPAAPTRAELTEPSSPGPPGDPGIIGG